MLHVLQARSLELQLPQTKKKKKMTVVQAPTMKVAKMAMSLMTVYLQLLVSRSLSVATTAADVSVGAKDGPDPQEGGDLEKQGQLQRKKNEKKNNLGSLVWFYLLVVVSILVVDGSKQSSSRCGSDQSGIDVTYAADNCDLACNLNSDVVIDKGSDSVKVKIVEMQDLHLDGNVSSSESSKVAKAIDAEGSIAEVCNDMSITLCVEACCNGPGVELALN